MQRFAALKAEGRRIVAAATAAAEVDADADADTNADADADADAGAESEVGKYSQISLHDLSQHSSWSPSTSHHDGSQMLQDCNQQVFVQSNEVQEYITAPATQQERDDEGFADDDEEEELEVTEKISMSHLSKLHPLPLSKDPLPGAQVLCVPCREANKQRMPEVYLV